MDPQHRSSITPSVNCGLGKKQQHTHSYETAASQKTQCVCAAQQTRKRVIITIKRDVSGDICVVKTYCNKEGTWVRMAHLHRHICLSDYSMDRDTVGAHNKPPQLLLFIGQKCTHIHTNTYPRVVHTPCYSQMRSVWSCQTPAETERGRRETTVAGEGWRFRGQIHLWSRITALRSRGLWGLTAYSCIHYVHASFILCKPAWENYTNGPGFIWMIICKH